MSSFEGSPNQPEQRSGFFHVAEVDEQHPSRERHEKGEYEVGRIRVVELQRSGLSNAVLVFPSLSSVLCVPQFGSNWLLG
jgi:hypothetical protein